MATPKAPSTAMRSGLGRVRGLGSAKDGVAHWWAQRVTALALVPLTLWFVFGIVALAGSPQAQVQAWIAHPVNTVLLVLLVAATFHHLTLGVQVVIEDYIHHEGRKLALLLGVKALAWVFGLAGVLAVLRIAL